MRAKELSGIRFGKLMAEKRVSPGKWICKCDCGKTRWVSVGKLLNGSITSCGCSSSRLKNLEGKRFGKLVVTQEHSRSRSGGTRWKCLCDCGKEVMVYSTHLIQGNTTSCGCGKPVGSRHNSWTGYEEISGDFWNNIRRGANGSKKRRKIEFEVTIKQMWELFLKQERKCVLSGVLLSFPSRQNDHTGTASLDRIDSAVGYVLGNVQWVHKDINKMKNSFNQDYFLGMCRRVARCTGGTCELVDLVKDDSCKHIDAKE